MNDIRIDTAKDQIAEKAWKSLLDESPCASFFQSPACYDFYAGLSFMEPFVLAVEESGRLTGLVCGYIIRDGGWLKSFFSRRAIVPGGALLAADISAEALEQLLKALRQYLKRKAIYVEFRNYTDYQNYHNSFETNGFQYQPHLNFQLDLTDRNEVIRGLNKSKRRQIKLSEAQELTCIVTEKDDEIKKFYLILSKLYKREINKPVFPLEFFQRLIENHWGKLLIVKKEDVVLGGIVLIEDQHTVYEWFVCGEKKIKQMYPSVLATWTAILYAMDSGHQKFDFMGAGQPGKAYGVRDFKAGFGGEQVEYGRYFIINEHFIYKISAIYIDILKLLMKN